MKCTSAGGSSSVSLAVTAAGLTTDRTQALFASLEKEGESQPAPSILDLQEWQERQEFLLERAELSAIHKDAIRQKLAQTFREPTPDGAEFYAWSRIEARARQERALYSVDGVVDLQPPGEHTHKYTLGEDGRPTHVWYASYGSNLNESRLLNYIRGGRPPGGSRTYSGCTDRTLPLADIPIRVHGFRPHFALNSSIWRGGIAFIDEADQESAFLGRAYLISVEQYDEIVAQENGLSAKFANPVDLTTTLTKGRETQGMGAYETNLHIGDYQGAPVLSFTAPFGVQDALGSNGVVQRKGSGVSTATTNKPSAAYCRMIGSGLSETFGMTEVAQADYIRGCPGGDKWERRDLVRALREPADAPNPPSTRNWTTKRAKGEFYAPVKTYESREEQRSGVAKWSNTLTKAKKSLAAVESGLAIMEKRGDHTKKELDEYRLVVADAMKSVKEAEKKKTRAREQQPKEWFKGRSSRTRRSWEQFANDLQKDITRTQTKFRNANPGTKEAGRLALKIEDLKEQHREATRKAEPLISSSKSTSGSSSSQPQPANITSGWIDSRLGRDPNPTFTSSPANVPPQHTNTADDLEAIPSQPNTRQLRPDSTWV